MCRETTRPGRPRLCPCSFPSIYEYLSIYLQSSADGHRSPIVSDRLVSRWGDTPYPLAGALLWCVLNSRYCWSSTALAGDAYGCGCPIFLPSFLPVSAQVLVPRQIAACLGRSNKCILQS